jgi:hypothetical protein
MRSSSWLVAWLAEVTANTHQAGRRFGLQGHDPCVVLSHRAVGDGEFSSLVRPETANGDPTGPCYDRHKGTGIATEARLRPGTGQE